MFRRTRQSRLYFGYHEKRPNESTMYQYSPYHWTYQLPQVMEPPKRVNRSLNGPYKSAYNNSNAYKGVWIDCDMHPTYRVALAPQLAKLPMTRHVPNTTVAEVSQEFRALAPLIDDRTARCSWLAKVIQLCAFRRDDGAAGALWNEFVSLEGDPVPLNLMQSMLFCCGRTGSVLWRPIFEKCLKTGWNYSPFFSPNLWSYILRCAGEVGDQSGVKLVLEEMLDVQANFDVVSPNSLVIALNSITDAPIYNYVKKFLFEIPTAKVASLTKRYNLMKSHPELFKRPLKENDEMLYHVNWHNSIRQPRGFNPRQQYFNYTPSFLDSMSKSEKKTAKIDDIIKNRIEKWKEEGLLPKEQEVPKVKVHDPSIRYKAVMRQEYWKKNPKYLKDPKRGYRGDPQ